MSALSDDKHLPLIGVVGAGTMGSGIALVALTAGAKVILQDPYPAMLEKAAAYIKKFLEKKDQAALLGNLTLTDSLEAFAPAGLVIEAALEQLELKKEIFAKLEAVCAPEAILATNTSTLSVTAVAATTQRPQRVAGMHFFNPAPVLPLVEVVRAAQTSQATIERLVGLTEALGKTPVVTGDTPGFIVNRVARPFYGEALRLLGEGVAGYEVIDQIVEGGGFKMGPFKLMDLIGIDINAGAMRSMYEQSFGEPRYKPHWIQMQKLAEGALGRKTGRGFYKYNGDGQLTGPSHLDHEYEQPEDAQRSVAGPPVAPAEGLVLISEGTWAPGLADICRQAGYSVASKPQKGQEPIACFMVAGRNEGAEEILRWYDQNLPADTPLIAQCVDMTLAEMRKWVSHTQRLMGFDGLFFASSSIATTIHSSIPAEKYLAVMDLFENLGRFQLSVQDSPGLILPRIVCQIINEAMFMSQDMRGSHNVTRFEIPSEEFSARYGLDVLFPIDKAMKLGVNYPYGPVEWCELIGYDKVLAVLDHLYAEYHEERYRACVLIRQWARGQG